MLYLDLYLGPLQSHWNAIVCGGVWSRCWVALPHYQTGGHRLHGDSN